ncbi:NAD-dependent epimerase/dehydratase family protein (plasmid) [Arsenophonus sp. aPb]|uniref:NAD-dependent epimerase/dehydratase family protein n=1 Tax=Arsenophonus sp. aPb TaxID=3041619 RepID=UPI0024686EEE|nr:NAD-dependent epimerase/dehydratase family protein [Arsenophonus sp. aPb]WGL99911.1 NAD-dependent epimerase/dehydratase family protein [Arsenophonus sp. aPb]
MSKIAITGSRGYIGRHVVDCLEKEGHDVLKLVHPLRDDNIYCNNNIVAMDILNATTKELKTSLQGVDKIVHFAWQSGFNHHDCNHFKNIMGHVNFITKLMKIGIKDISIAGTMHEIGYYVGEVDENTPCNPVNPYGIAKNFLRQIALYEAVKNNVLLKWLRLYYITGADHLNNSIFSKILKSNAEGKHSFPLNSGEMLYDFIHIDDLSKQISKAIIQDFEIGIINCCSGTPISLRNAVENFIKKHNLNIKPEYNAFPKRNYDSPAIWGNNFKIKQIMEAFNKND